MRISEIFVVLLKNEESCNQTAKPLVCVGLKMPLAALQVLSPPSLCCLDPRRCLPHPSMPASPTPGSPQPEVRHVTQEALSSFGDLGPVLLHGGPLARRLPPSNSRGPQESQPSSDEQKRRRPLLHSQHQVQHALPLWSPYLGQRSTFQTRCTTQPRARGALALPVPTTTPLVQARSPPAHPSSHATLICSLSLARCPLPALELLVPGTAMRLLQAPGWPPALRTFGRP